MAKKIKYIIFVLIGIITISFTIIAQNKVKKVGASYTYKDVVFYGNDISKWKGEVDFAKMDTLSDFVILRIGYSTALDTKFVSYVRSARNQGLNVGVYIYSLAESKQDAINEANWVVSTLQMYGLDKGVLTFPIYFDYEEDSIISSKSKAENTEIINAFASVILKEGYYPGVYMGASHFSKYVNADSLICDVWLAQYFGSNDPSKFSAKLNNNHKSVKMWQFAAGPYQASSGTISSHVKYSGKELGVSSRDIDENWCFVNYPSIIKNGGYNGHIIGGGLKDEVSVETSKNEPISSSNSSISSSQSQSQSANSSSGVVSNNGVNNSLNSSNQSTLSGVMVKKQGCKSNVNGIWLISFLSVIPLTIFIKKLKK